MYVQVVDSTYDSCSTIYLLFMSCKYVFGGLIKKTLQSFDRISRVSPLELWFELKICKVSNEYKVSYPGQGKIAQ